MVEACQSGRLEARVGLVVSNNRSAEVLEFAKVAGVPHRRIGGLEPEDRDRAMLAALKDHEVDLVLLLGYLKLLGPLTIEAYPGRILNTHPSLLPRHGGKGMYGLAVHEAVIASNETETGITIHCVDGEYDNGQIVAQTRVGVTPGDDPQALAERVIAREHEFLVDTVRDIACGRIALPGRGPS